MEWLIAVIILLIITNHRKNKDPFSDANINTRMKIERYIALKTAKTQTADSIAQMCEVVDELIGDYMRFLGKESKNCTAIFNAFVDHQCLYKGDKYPGFRGKFVDDALMEYAKRV